MKFHEFYEELKRRNVFRVGMVYAVTAWVSIQVIATVFPILKIPEWTVTLLTVLILIGFPFALIIAWAFELTPDGIRKSTDTTFKKPLSEESSTVEEAAKPDNLKSPHFSRLLKTTGAAVLIAVLGLAWYVNREPAAPSDIQRSIAVLPFETIDTEQSSSFTKGIQGGLMTRLSSIAGLRVTSRTSTLQYAGVAKPIPTIGEELGVDWIVRGEVQEVNGQILVNTRLLKASEDRLVWAKDYRRQLSAENIFEIQIDLTREIAGELQAQITTEEGLRVDRKPTADLQAFREFAQGVSLLEQRTPNAILSSVDHFRAAIEQDSSFAPAWAILAEALIYIEFYQYADINTYPFTAKEAIDKALEINPDLAEAHASQGILRYTRKNGTGAIESLKKAIELQPSYETANNWLNFVYLLTGQPEESLTYAREAVKLSPLAPAARLYPSLSYLANGQYQEALYQVNRAREIQPDWGEIYAIRGVILYHNQQYEEALESLFIADRLIENEVASIWVPDVRTMIEITAITLNRELTESEADIRLPYKESRFWPGLKYAAMGSHDQSADAFSEIQVYSMWPNLSMRYFFPELLKEYRTRDDFDALLRDMNEVWNR